jgi:hypothetical protein
MSATTQIPAMDVAFSLALLDIADEWDGETCAACGAQKWKAHPFCRSCSIRLQRLGLMRGLKVFVGHKSSELMNRLIERVWVRRYDRARDYLITSQSKRRDSSDAEA